MSYPKTFAKFGNPDLTVNDFAQENSAIANGYSESQKPTIGFPVESAHFTGRPSVNNPRFPIQGIQGAHGPAGVEAHRTDPVDPRTGSRTLHPLAPAPDQRTPFTGDPVSVDQFGNPYRADPAYVGDPAYPGNPAYPVRAKEPFIGFGKTFKKLNAPDVIVHNAAEEAVAIADGYVFAGGAF